jgi:hypothetical protein
LAKFQSFWFGDHLTPYQLLALKSFVDFGHEYVLYAYKEFDVPAGVELRDAKDILPEDRVFFYGDRAGIGRGSVAAFSNLFRYHLLHQTGGWWVDADVICLSETVPATSIFMGWESEHVVGTAILKFPERHQLVRELRDTAEHAGTDLAWGETGPSLLTRILREHGLSELVSPQAQSYPVQFCDAVQLLIPARCEEIRARIRNGPFLHLWSEILRRAVVIAWMAPPPGSLMAELFDRHGINLGHAPVYTAAQAQRLFDNLATRMEVDHLRLVTQMEVDHLRLVTQMEVDHLQRQLHETKNQLLAFQNSTSWRMTALIRHLVTILRNSARFP